MPWNKGKKLSLETRLRMSLARKGYMQSKTTRRKISKAHTSLPITPVQPQCNLSSARKARPCLTQGRSPLGHCKPYLLSCWAMWQPVQRFKGLGGCRRRRPRWRQRCQGGS